MRRLLFSSLTILSLWFLTTVSSAYGQDPFISNFRVTTPQQPGPDGATETNGVLKLTFEIGDIGEATFTSQGKDGVFISEGFGLGVSLLPAVSKAPDGKIILRAPNGTSLEFTSAGRSTDILGGDERTLRAAPDGKGFILNAGGKTTLFGQETPTGFFPTTFTDLLGNSTSIIYNAPGSPIPQKVVGANGHVTATFTTTNGVITQVTDQYGLSTGLRYDSVGRLTQVTKPDGGNRLQLSYSPSTKLPLPTTIRDERNDQTLVNYSVPPGGQNGFVSTVARPDGTIVSYSFGSTFSEVSEKSSPTKRIDFQNGLPVQFKEGATIIQKIERAPNGDVVSVTDPTGTTKFEQAQGKLSVVYPDGTRLSLERDASNRITKDSRTDKTGQTREKIYSYKDQALQKVAYLSGGREVSSEQYTYQDNKLASVQRTTNTDITLNEQGLPTRALLGDGSNTSITRNPNGSVQTTNGESLTTECIALSDGGVSQVVSGTSGVTRFSRSASVSGAGANHAWRTTFGDMTSSGSRDYAITLDRTTATNSCQWTDGRCTTTVSCVPNQFGSCDNVYNTQCQGTETPLPKPPTNGGGITGPGPVTTPGSGGAVTGPQPGASTGGGTTGPGPGAGTIQPGYCAAASGKVTSNGCNKAAGYSAKVMNGFYCSCVK